ncbi:hypothetical protein F66182_6305 [Fusarium sp. NRRL 66182]|nr:hypothetical protein F66182_6305 [Fusarium sp. NRRL 66182]
MSSFWINVVFSLFFCLWDTSTGLPTSTSRPPPSSTTIPTLKNAYLSKRQQTFQPRLSLNFPDPCLLHDRDGRWVSFATSGNGYHIQAAVADDPFGEWTHLKQDALPGDGWTSGRNYWAPDARRLDQDDSYIMYFSGENPEGGHCIGAARSKNSTGPYKMDDKPIICPKDEGGAIDPAGFLDSSTGYRYVVYKVDGNSLGNDSPTPIRLQRVAEDGSTPIGKPLTILDRIASEDGPLVEAPSLVRTASGQYLLFFSSHMYTDNEYDVKYALADKVEGPYIRGEKPFLKTPELGLNGPGGGTSSEDGEFMVFHAWCEKKKRCMYAIGYGVV